MLRKRKSRRQLRNPPPPTDEMKESAQGLQVSRIKLQEFFVTARKSFHNKVGSVMKKVNSINLYNTHTHKSSFYPNFTDYTKQLEIEKHYLINACNNMWIS